MSGGSMNYLCYQVEEVASCFNNPMIRELIKDMSKLMHDKEWTDSGDYSDGEYNATEKEFCEKWFKDTAKTFESIIENEICDTRNTLINAIGLSKYCKDCKHWHFEKEQYGRCKDNKWSTHGYEFGCNDWSEAKCGQKKKK